MSVRSLLLALLVASVALPPGAARAQGRRDASATTTVASEGFAYMLLTYLPNRVYDGFDLVRLRARLGPGFALSLRATRWLRASRGDYRSLYAGLPGPRGEPSFPPFLGFEESRPRILVGSVPDPQGRPPGYGTGEFGAGLHAGLVGADFGIDPLEALDLALGFLLMDPMGDDY